MFLCNIKAVLRVVALLYTKQALLPLSLKINDRVVSFCVLVPVVD